MVRPRVANVITNWPDAATLSGFRKRLDSENLAEFLTWRATSRKLTVITDLADTLYELGIETVRDMADHYDGHEREHRIRTALRRVKFVGPKTIDYLAILTGSTAHVAVDTHITRFVHAAGIRTRDYVATNALIIHTARELGCSAGALDAAIWSYLSDRKARKAVREVTSTGP